MEKKKDKNKIEEKKLEEIVEPTKEKPKKPEDKSKTATFHKRRRG